MGVLVLNVPSSVARSSQATGQVLLVDDRAGKPRLRDADRCVDPGSDDDAGSYCVLHPEDITAMISTVAHAPPSSTGITEATSAKLNALLANEAISHDPVATVVYRVRGAADGTRATMRSALETGTAGSGAVIHSRDVASGTDCDAAWKVVAGFDATEGSTNALVHDRCGGDDDGLIVDENVLEKVAALAGATLVTLDGGQDGTRDDGGGLGFRFDDLGGGVVVVEPWHPGTASGGGRLAADSWRWRLSRELSCLLRLPAPAARVPPYYVEMRSAGLAANVHGVGSPEHVAVSRLVFAAVGLQSTRGAGVAKVDAAEESPDTVFSIVIACDSETVKPSKLGRESRARRRLAEEAETAQMFRRMVTATVTGVFLFVAAFVGILAMGTMTFPRDCLLWPSDKTMMKYD